MVHIRRYLETDFETVINLWRLIFPDAPAHNDPAQDIQSKMAIQPELFFVGILDDLIVGTAMSGFDGHRGWVYYVAVHPDHRRKGIGTELMQRVESALHASGCPKINLQIRADNAEVRSFYASMGYEVEERISMGKRLGARSKTYPTT